MSFIFDAANLGGSAAVAKVLIEEGAQVDRPDKTGTTPLMVCNTQVEQHYGPTSTFYQGEVLLVVSESI